ncbi:MAG: GntR family transcriptional regulator [Pseudomonadota bacterium]
MNVIQPADGIARTIVRKPLHLELVDHLQELIVEGALTPGHKVPERALCEQFGVSRTPMREALKVLAADGLVTLEPNRGAWVTAVTLEELEEVFPVMGALEALSGELAAERITDAEIDGVRRHHQEMVDAYLRRDRAPYFRANQAIHEAILEAARNKTLSTQYRGLAVRIRRARYLANMTEERWRNAVAEHEEILEALEARDGPRLAEILKRHLKNKFNTVRDWISSQSEIEA